MKVERVYKYPLQIGDWQILWLPSGAEILCVQVQDGKPFVWARVTVGNPPEARHLRLAGTGHNLGSNVGKFVGSFQMHEGLIVFHLFEELGENKP